MEVIICSFGIGAVIGGVLGLIVFGGAVIILALSCLCAALAAICLVQWRAFVIETRRLNQIAVDYRDAANVEADMFDEVNAEAFRLRDELAIARDDLAEADAELNRLRGGRLERRTTVVH